MIIHTARKSSPVDSMYLLKDCFKYALPARFLLNVEAENLIGIKMEHNLLVSSKLGDSLGREEAERYWNAYKSHVEEKKGRWIILEEIGKKGVSLVAHQEEDGKYVFPKTSYPTIVPRFPSGLESALGISIDGNIFKVRLNSDFLPGVLFCAYKIKYELMNPGYLIEAEGLNFAIKLICDQYNLPVPRLIPYQLNLLSENIRPVIKFEPKLETRQYRNLCKLLNLKPSDEIFGSEPIEEEMVEDIEFSSHLDAVVLSEVLESFKTEREFPNHILEVVPDVLGFEVALHMIITFGYLNIVLPDDAIPEMMDVLKYCEIPEEKVNFFPVGVEEQYHV